MSFSFSKQGGIDTLKQEIAENVSLPEPIKAYISLGFDALVKRHGHDVPMMVSAYGHLHNSEEGNHEETTATVSVKRV